VHKPKRALEGEFGRPALRLRARLVGRRVDDDRGRALIVRRRNDDGYRHDLDLVGLRELAGCAELSVLP
jgi:hypothetical protein